RPYSCVTRPAVTTACIRTSTAPWPSPCRWWCSSAARARTSKAGSSCSSSSGRAPSPWPRSFPARRARWWSSRIATGRRRAPEGSIARTCATGSAACARARASRSASSSTTRPDRSRTRPGLDPYPFGGQGGAPQTADDGADFLRIARGEHAQGARAFSTMRARLVEEVRRTPRDGGRAVHERHRRSQDALQRTTHERVVCASQDHHVHARLAQRARELLESGAEHLAVEMA